MDTLKAMTCKNCGANIDRRTMRCDYCGTEYESSNERIKIIVDRPGIHTIRCETRVDMVKVEPRVSLQPFRTFIEVEQPESEFLLRINERGEIGFFPADGGVWKLEATRNVAGYFEEALEDLISAGAVVVIR